MVLDQFLNRVEIMLITKFLYVTYLIILLILITTCVYVELIWEEGNRLHKSYELSTLADAVRTLRKKKSLKQSELAALADISLSTLRAVEQAETWPNLLIISKISKALGVSLPSLIKGSTHTQEDVENCLKILIDEVSCDK